MEKVSRKHIILQTASCSIQECLLRTTQKLVGEGRSQKKCTRGKHEDSVVKSISCLEISSIEVFSGS